MSWPPPRWMVSACRTTSSMLMRTSRRVSSQSGPSLHTHCQPATIESLISSRYCTPTVLSTTMLGPLLSGPHAQIFWVSDFSQPYLSTRKRVVAAVAERARLAEEAVVLVGRLGEHGARRLGVDRLAVGDDGVGDGDGRAVHEVLLQVLEADLDVQLAAAGDDVLARLLHGALHERVRLGKALEALDELGEVVGVLGGDGDAHDGRDGVLHGDDRVRVRRVGVGQGARLDDVLVDADDAARVAGGARVDRLGLAPHHETGARP